MNETYFNAVRLLLKVAPYVFDSEAFALKGGTAINLFVRDMPRLSVDLDLVYREHSQDRKEAMATISAELRRIESHLVSNGLSCEPVANAAGDEIKIYVQEGQTRIKVEINHVFRGTLRPVAEVPLQPAAEDRFLMELHLPLLAREELYGSKLVAAMDRQHPRDLFDVLGLYENGGLKDGVVECFVGYLAGHNRPVHEVLFAREADIRQAYANEFNGMTLKPVELERLLAVRERLFRELPRALSKAHRGFLLSLVAAEPDWELMSFAHLREMPAIRWKLQNLKKLRSTNPAKFKDQLAQLHSKFERLDGS